MTRFDRRSFLRRAAALGGGAMFAPSLGALTGWSALDAAGAARLRPLNNGGYRDLVRSPDCPELWIPPEFRVVAVSRAQQASQADAGFIVPTAMDGMSAFALPNGNIRLIRNHEMANAATRAAPLGTRLYDRLASGGTTSLEIDVSDIGVGVPSVVSEYVSLGGTHINCAGGRTPWNSWLTCEETTNGPSRGFEQPHGYIFDVPVGATAAVEPVPLRAMGRFVHEAVAVDPRTGIVYETEDIRWAENNPARPGAGFYRFIPNRNGVLHEGGRLQILGVAGRPVYNTVAGQTVGARLDVAWFDIEDPDPASAEADPSAVFREGRSKGGAIFERLEGCFWADDSCYFVSTSGGDARAGQVWRYVPGDGDGGWLTLIFESPSRDVLDAPDNICVSARGGIVICEDGLNEQYIRGLTPAGAMVDLVMQPDTADDEPDPPEFAGCCFSPDGRVLFFNVQGSTRSYGRAGATYALWGPWENGSI
ncbi:DUF839 domain-containing protein [soil metagenome]